MSLKPSSIDLKDRIKAEACDLGFVGIGFTPPNAEVGYAQYLSWLAQGHQAEMSYLSRPDALQKRGNACMLYTDCQTIICLAYPYPAPSKPGKPGHGQIAAYALSADYHDRIRTLSDTLLQRIIILSNGEASGQIHVDTSPILEKAYAQHAGLGFIGRNSLLIHPEYGSYFFLSEILLNLCIEPDTPSTKDGCGSCQRCVNACPTQAILPNRSIDARRCLSYLTIEHRGSIPDEFKAAVGQRVFGCDSCQTVCPYNTKPKSRQAHEPQLIDPAPSLAASLALSEAAFQTAYAHTPVARAKVSGFRRNIAIAMGNSADPSYLPQLEQCLVTENELAVLNAISWAIRQLNTQSQVNS